MGRPGGVYLPGDRVESQAMTGVGAPTGKVQPMLTVVPGDGSGHESGKAASPSLIDEIVRAAGLAMAFKLTESAQARWRCVNAPHLVALVRAGAVFGDGALIERPGQAAA